MLTCKEAIEHCSFELDRPLRLGEKLFLHGHLMMCTRCTHYRQQIRTLRDAMQTYAAGAAPGDDPVANPQSHPHPPQG